MQDSTTNTGHKAVELTPKQPDVAKSPVNPEAPKNSESVTGPTPDVAKEVKKA